MYQAVLRLMRSLLIIWPFFRSVGAMLDFAVNLGEVERGMPLPPGRPARLS